jgi:hypothetical protein
MTTRLGAKHWRERAEETRVLAEQMTGEEARHAMMRVADDCDQIADRDEAVEPEQAAAGQIGTLLAG